MILSTYLSHEPLQAGVRLCTDHGLGLATLVQCFFLFFSEQQVFRERRVLWGGFLINLTLNSDYSIQLVIDIVVLSGRKQETHNCKSPDARTQVMTLFFLPWQMTRASTTLKLATPKEALSVLMLCTPVFIFTSCSSALLGHPHCGLLI